MKNPLGILILVGAIAVAAILVLRSPKSPSTQAAAPTDVATPTPEAAAQLSADSSPATSLTVAKPASTPAPITPATPLVTAATTPTTAAVTPASSGPVTKHPKTLNELYRTFDAINAASEATTPESLASLIDFAATENADVRTAAINAIINRDDVSAAPLLRKAAKQLDDSKAIIALLETADYIELPSTTMTAIAALPKNPKAPARPGEHTPKRAATTP
ncbi:MAG: HEAT repeat domain-containing protein [Opitutaceae bacterium]|nr:HEAT repeat domain-containing protein [Opitutaceae bacterium]